MKKNSTIALCIFRRDLRLEDNTALRAALENSSEVLPCFIFDPRQVGEKNQYRSTNCIQFMIESLQDLDTALHKKGGRLYTFYGLAEKILEELLEKIPIKAVYLNKDYTPFSRLRDAALEKICKKLDIPFLSFDDLLLIPPTDFLNKQNKPYKVFTPFFRTASQRKINEPLKNNFKNFYKKEVSAPTINLSHELTPQGLILKTKNKSLATHGGSSRAHSILKNIGDFKNYNHTHNIPTLSTTHLSAHLKFGTVSIRETFYAIKKQLGGNHPLIRQLYWRDFFTHIAWHFPHVFGHAFKKEYDAVAWNWDAKKFKQWCSGTTGFPIVDAGMRQMNQTGFMHNRVRMIVASFLTKDLHIDWREGEKYFAQQLVDYDPSVNNGNWQWCASTGADAQPYFRIFNPWEQQKKFDPECAYIKTWVPELKDISPKIIHTLFKEGVPGYPAPILEHAQERLKTLAAYKKIK